MLTDTTCNFSKEVKDQTPADRLSYWLFCISLSGFIHNDHNSQENFVQTNMLIISPQKVLTLNDWWKVQINQIFIYIVKQHYIKGEEKSSSNEGKHLIITIMIQSMFSFKWRFNTCLYCVISRIQPKLQGASLCKVLASPLLKVVTPLFIFPGAVALMK